jgi:hypothetical protein
MGTMRIREPSSHIRATVVQAAKACIAVGWEGENEEIVGNSLLNVLAEAGIHHERTRENITEAAAVVFCVWDTNADMGRNHGTELHGSVCFDVEGPFEGPDNGDEPNPMDDIVGMGPGDDELYPLHSLN